MTFKTPTHTRAPSTTTAKAMTSPYLVCTVFGSSVVERGSLVYVKEGDSYTRKPIEDVTVNEEVLFHKQGIPGISIDNPGVARALATSSRYTDTFSVLFVKLEDGVYAPKFMVALLKGMALNEGGSWPATVASNPEISAILGGRHVRLTTVQGTDAADYIRGTLETSGVEPVTEEHIRFAWLKGHVIAPNNRRAVVGALSSIANSLLDLLTAEFEKAYRLYKIIRSDTISNLSLLLKGGTSGSSASTGSIAHVSIRPELEAIIKELAINVTDRFAAAKVLKIGELQANGEEHEAESGSLSKGIVTWEVRDPNIKVKSPPAAPKAPPTKTAESTVPTAAPSSAESPKAPEPLAEPAIHGEDHLAKCLSIFNSKLMAVKDAHSRVVNIDRPAFEKAKALATELERRISNLESLLSNEDGRKKVMAATHEIESALEEIAGLHPEYRKALHPEGNLFDKVESLQRELSSLWADLFDPQPGSPIKHSKDEFFERAVSLRDSLRHVQFNPTHEELQAIERELRNLKAEISRFQVESEQAGQLKQTLSELQRNMSAIIDSFPQRVEQELLTQIRSLNEMANVLLSGSEITSEQVRQMQEEFAEFQRELKTAETETFITTAGELLTTAKFDLRRLEQDLTRLQLTPEESAGLQDFVSNARTSNSSFVYIQNNRLFIITNSGNRLSSTEANVAGVIRAGNGEIVIARDTNGNAINAAYRLGKVSGLVNGAAFDPALDITFLDFDWYMERAAVLRTEKKKTASGIIRTALTSPSIRRPSDFVHSMSASKALPVAKSIFIQEIIEGVPQEYRQAAIACALLADDLNMHAFRHVERTLSAGTTLTEKQIVEHSVLAMAADSRHIILLYTGLLDGLNERGTTGKLRPALTSGSNNKGFIGRLIPSFSDTELNGLTDAVHKMNKRSREVLKRESPEGGDALNENARVILESELARFFDSAAIGRLQRQPDTRAILETLAKTPSTSD